MIAIVTWQDAWDDAVVWTAVDDLDNSPRVIVSVGHLVSVDERQVVLALSWDQASQCLGHVIHIPAPVVQDIKLMDLDLPAVPGAGAAEQD